MISSNSTSNIRVALGGIKPPAPCSPYPNLEGIMNLALAPLFYNIIPSSQPGITLPIPTGKAIGSPLSIDESKIVPSAK